MKKVLSIMFLLIFTMCLGGCNYEPIKYYEDEYFTYVDRVYAEEEWIYLTGFTKRGLEQEILIIPSEFNGKKVIIGTTYIVGSLVIFSSEHLKKIYLEEELTSYGSLAPYNYDTKIIHLSGNKNIPVTPSDGKIYVNREAYERSPLSKVYPANVSYKWNYEEAPNSGYYWIDDYYNEIISYIPTDPTREGYIFDGWYKEPECINKWDFDNDIVPGTEWESINVSPHKKLVKYQETVLYAKWVEC